MKDNFKIEKGVLKEYTGDEQDVTVPDRVKKIGSFAFAKCNSLMSITIPKGVEIIDTCAFSGCSSLTNVIIPQSMRRVEEGAFMFCPNLTNITIHADGVIFDDNAFDRPLPDGMVRRFDSLYLHMTKESLLSYLVYTDLWKHISFNLRADIFFHTKGYFVNVYKELLQPGEEEILGRTMLDLINPNSPEINCLAVSEYVTSFSQNMSDQLLQDTYDKLRSLENGVRGTRIIEKDSSLKERLLNTEERHKTAVDQKVTDLSAGKMSIRKIESVLKKEYGLKMERLPALLDNSGSVTSPTVLAWLLITGRQENRELSADEKEVLSLLNTASFMKALKILADENLGQSGRSKGMYLAYPICRYANDELLVELTKRAPKWKSSNSGNNAPPLKTFRDAILYNDSRTAMLFADQCGDLGKYAILRRKKEDDFRNSYLSDVDLDAEGRKQYDLGNQTVIAVLQQDFSFTVELPDSGDVIKSLPKKGADASKYEAAKKDFSALKRSVKKIAKNRCAILFREFLEGKDISASEWKKVYIGNPVLKNVASLFVWKQGEKTFTLTKNGIIDKDGLSIKLSNERIEIAHPMDMNDTDIEAWQNYYAQKGLRQPFAQVWEPVIDAEGIKEDRYKGCMIPYYWFRNQEKHGIRVEDQDFHNSILIEFEDCNAYVERINWRRHEIDNDDLFEVQRFWFEEYTRKVNHIVSFLDRITVFDRIKKDDITVYESIKKFTLAQVLECINAANESGSKNCLAVLLEEKNNRWPEYRGLNSLIMDEM